MRVEASTLKRSDLEAIRDRILSGVKLGKQAPGYKAAKAALERFLAEL